MLSDIYAQQYEFGISGVGSGYMGDINTSNPFYFKNIGGGLFAKYNLNPTWGIRLGYNHLYLSAGDRDFSTQKYRDLQFNNAISELAITAEFNFFRYIAGRELNRYTPYILAGLAGIMHDPFLNYDSKKVLLRELKLEVDKEGTPVKYSKFAFSIPVGAGFKYNIKGPWSIGAEIVYRMALSDNIDGIGEYYSSEDAIELPSPNKNNLTKEDLIFLADPSRNLDLNQGRARGDGKKFDGYMTAGITLTYTIISKKCYWWQ
ncbi:hypothetical protein M472_13065 [Sphingobacterium paucimobilis HER1398]|uniref:DUF6089 domain-containing protein n=2 Tax=Sphingobacterium TaxID=28453 RepID=U2J437_9SPHI|nr:hypothetical protein M472_13065 [Sphingobacterium paucimobilis HER1398]